MSTRFEALPLRVQHHINEVCDRFEAAWKEGPPPRLEDFLGEAVDAERLVLVQELIRVDVDYRKKRGEEPQAAEYLKRFPFVDQQWLTRLLPAARVAPVAAGPTAGHDSDRNLLFGIMSLQMDFISRDALIAAMHAWMLSKKKSLSAILVEQGALGADAQGLLEALVQKHLEVHNKDAQQSLAALGSLGSVQEELEQFADSDLKQSLSFVSARRRHRVDPEATAPQPSRPPAAAVLRYRKLRPHGEGGLGRVTVARDEELHREVALKEIKDKYADDPECRQRFVLEAEITSGLEHPGIVPVYGLGQYADGRPFYAMRFIKGESLRAAIDRFHDTAVGRRDPRQRRLVFRQLLACFIKVCEAVAYAHSRGVLHRDLKPDNIMLGKYGETLVVDWGLAKPVGRSRTAQDAGELTHRPPSSSNVSATQAGELIGTPAFMSPEQADGQLDRIGPRSDVYSLGATLYTLLTGESPLKAASMNDLMHKLKSGNIRLPRQVNKETPRGLEAICMKAMALRPDDRYGTALELAADIEHWLADEPVAAWQEPLWSRTMRWLRHHRPVVAGAVALLVTAVVALAVSTILVTAQQAHTEQARKKTLQSLELFTKVTEEQLVELPEMDKDLQHISDLLKEIDAGSTRDREIPLIHFRLAKAWKRLGSYDKAVEHYQQAIRQFTMLQANSGDNEHRYWLAICHNELGDTLRRRKSQDAKQEFDRALELQGELEAAFADEAKHRYEAARTYNNYGLWLIEHNKSDDADKQFQQAQGRLLKLTSASPATPAYQTDLAEVRINQGYLLEATEPDKSIRIYGEAIDILRNLEQTAPTNWKNQMLLALACNNRGQLLNRLANKEANKTLVRWSGSIIASLSSLAMPGAWVGAPCLFAAAIQDRRLSINAEQKHRDDAEKHLRQAIHLFAGLTINFPHQHEYWRGFGLSWYNLGELDWDSGKKKDAGKDWQRAETAWQKIADNPGYHQYKALYGYVRQNLAAECSARGEWGEARKHLEVAIRYLQDAWELTKENPWYPGGLGSQYRFLLDMLVKQGDNKEAARKTADFLKVFHAQPDELYLGASALADAARKAKSEAATSARADSYVSLLMMLLKDDSEPARALLQTVLAASQDDGSAFFFLRGCYPAFQELLQTAQPARDKQKTSPR
jgi:serine/threonine-protein kinase